MDKNKFKNKNCQKVELCGSLTTKESKKKHSFRLVGREVIGSWGREDVWQGSGWRTGAGQVAAGGVDGPTFACR